MKKLFFLTIAALFVSTGLFAQKDWGWGIKVGGNVSNINGLYAGKAKVGLNAGLFADRIVNDWFSFQTELMYSQQGVRKHFGRNIYVQALDYINVPFLMKFYFDCGLNVQVGPQVGYLVRAKETEFTNRGNQAHFNKFNVDAVIGLAYDFQFGLILEARYNVGITPLVKSYAVMFPYGESHRWTNGTASLSAGWKF